LGLAAAYRIVHFTDVAARTDGNGLVWDRGFLVCARVEVQNQQNGPMRIWRESLPIFRGTISHLNYGDPLDPGGLHLCEERSMTQRLWAAALSLEQFQGYP
jgi:hypothetical protein